jgi:hypothetical protein
MTKITSEAVASKPIFIVMAKDAVKSQQDRIRSTLLNLDQDIHENAVQCVLHASHEYGHGDTSLMTRLLTDIIDAKTGYRRAGLINWMRKFTPMELSGKTINLSGVDEKGNRRPWRIEEAASTPFWTDRDNAEKVGRPVYQDTLMSGVDRSITQLLAAIENTIDGKPIDPSKPYFDGLNAPKLVDFATKVKELRGNLPEDPTLAVRKATRTRDEAQAVIDAAVKAA